MNLTMQWASIAGNSITVLTAIGVLARVGWKRFKVLMAHKVTGPLTHLQSSVDALKADIEAAREDAQRANKRMDDHLQSHGTYGGNPNG